MSREQLTERQRESALEDLKRECFSSSEEMVLVNRRQLAYVLGWLEAFEARDGE